MSHHNKVKTSLFQETASGECSIKTRFTNFTRYLSFIPTNITRANFEIFDLITVTIYVIYVKIDHHTLSLWRDSKQNSIFQAA